MTALLRVEGLAKRYGASTVFENVHFTVAAGEFVAIVGDSGVGKSTLLNCLAGLDTWDAGRVLHAGTDLAVQGETQRALWRRAHVGFVFQAFHVLPHLDVAQNVGLPLMLLGRGDAARVRQMLQAVGLADLGERLPQQLSGGQLQRVAIARALVHRPALLLADEPTGNLDRSTAQAVFTRMLDMARRRGTAFVMVTHDETLAAQCQRVLRLDGGRLVDVSGAVQRPAVVGPDA
jgi:putative ABC transport system ATP-binding protein